jgi:hypothetical protein
VAITSTPKPATTIAKAATTTPQWCRWISADVYFDIQDGILGTNMYAYCQGDPMNFRGLLKFSNLTPNQAKDLYQTPQKRLISLKLRKITLISPLFKAYFAHLGRHIPWFMPQKLRVAD